MVKRITISEVNQTLQELLKALLGDGVNVGFIQETKDRLKSIENKIAKEVAPNTEILNLQEKIVDLENKLEHLRIASDIAVKELQERIWKSSVITAFIMGSLGLGLGSWIF